MALVNVLARAGPHIGEALELEMSSFAPPSGELPVRHSKGGKQRSVRSHWKPGPRSAFHFAVWRVAADVSAVRKPQMAIAGAA